MIEQHIVAVTHDADLVIAPAFEEGGHDHHNQVGLIAKASRPRGGLVQYLSYVRGFGRSDHGIEIVPTLFESEQKALALACYASQAAWPATKPWFGTDQREHIL